MVPLGFERFRICELFAELLHCSNMSLLNAVRHDTSTNGFFELKNDYNNYEQASNSNDPDANYQTQKVDESSTAMDIQGIENSKQKDSQQDEELTIDQTTKPVSSPILMEIVEETPAPQSTDYNTQTNNFNGSVSSELPVGDLLKSKFVEHKIIPTCLVIYIFF
jgi:serine/threonine-protein phosphatase 6 regulatory subunit 3